MARKIPRCIEGRHVPSRTLVPPDPLDPNSRRARCTRCGHLLVMSPITHRWRLTGPLG